MTFVSYAQNFEDVVLWRALKGVDKGFYIDVGAAWPDYHSVTRAFYERGWRGINIEPNPSLLHEINLARPRDVNLGVAVGETEGSVTLRIVSNPGLSTVDEAIAVSHETLGYETQALSVEMLTIAQICAAHVPQGQEIHFLKVDVEGLELEVLRGNDWTRFRPWILVVEAMEPMSQVENHAAWEGILTEAGYAYVYCDGLNRYFLAQEHKDLSDTFRYPLNLFDDYMSVDRQSALLEAEKNARLLDEAKADIARIEAEAESLAAKLATATAEHGKTTQSLVRLVKLVERDHKKARLRRIGFQRDGTPREALLALVMHRTNGRFRSNLKRLVFCKDGVPRRAFLLWALKGYRYGDRRALPPQGTLEGFLESVAADLNA